MNKYSKMTSAYIVIWPVASLINAVISTILIHPNFSGETFGTLVIVFVFSCIFSLPILFIAMLTSAIVLRMLTNDDIFGAVFLVTLFSSFAGAIYFKDTLDIVGSNPVLLGASIVVSALAAVVIFRNKLKADPVIEE